MFLFHNTNIQYESLQLICSHYDCYGHIDKECSKKKVSEVVPQQQAPEIPTFATNPSGKIFEFGKTNGVLGDDNQAHASNATKNDVAEEQNWIEGKGMVRESSANSVKKKPAQVGTRVHNSSAQLNTPLKFAVRKRQRSALAQSSPELRQISSVHASTSGTKDDGPLQEEARNEAPLVAKDPPQSQPNKLN
ncbi:hypothetical protein PIB30_092944 [Stylosanthes scabra]|uniref:Uncharacterized protein n=1 Tax=Stylosanthes scabra TaxID=79078 RepID=A0ABU6QVN3_9FABA|nr:hypothetical protein [Stylosanthes scabra]